MTSEHETAAITIRSWTDRFRAVALSVIFVFIVGTSLLIDGLDRPGWARQALVPAVAAYLAITLLVMTWRICLMGVRFDDQGVTVRNFFRTYRLRWPEVREFTDGSASVGETEVWALKIVLCDGHAVTAAGTMRSDWRKGGDPLRSPRATIEQVAARYQVPVQLTGRPIRVWSRH